MKIRILTFALATNYGALLQTYALSRVLQEAGHEVELYKISLFKPSLRSFIREHFYARFAGVFRKKYLPPFVNLSAQLDADCYIVGSDQVWNPRYIPDLGYVFFFDFLPANCKKIAYAASFGEDDWTCTNDQKVKIISCLNNFSHISIRENLAISRFTKTFGMDAKFVLDPTLLLSDYKSISGEINLQNTLVCFKFRHEPKYFDVIHYIAKELGLEVFRLDRYFIKYKGYEYIRRYCSVSNWVKEIAQAAFVVTDSFHGMLFSIIYKKPFVVFSPYQVESNRMLSLLKLLGLESRYYYSYEDIFQSMSWKNEIDYNQVDEKLTKLKKESIRFLFEAVEN